MSLFGFIKVHNCLNGVFLFGNSLSFLLVCLKIFVQTVLVCFHGCFLGNGLF